MDYCLFSSRFVMVLNQLTLSAITEILNFLQDMISFNCLCLNQVMWECHSFFLFFSKEVGSRSRLTWHGSSLIGTVDHVHQSN